MYYVESIEQLTELVTNLVLVFLEQKVKINQVLFDSSTSVNAFFFAEDVHCSLKR